MNHAKRLGILGVLLVAAEIVHAADLGTAFTYQGRLVKNGTPIGSPSSVNCDFTFNLFDVPTGGTPLNFTPVGPQTISVANGLFTTQIDFGPDTINGQARYLEITVQCPGDMSATTLTPRQELKPAPHALALPGLYTVQNGISPSLIGGNYQNAATSGVTGATIAGGGLQVPDNNQVTDSFGTVSGGYSNIAGDNSGTANDAPSATVGGGFQNWAIGPTSTVSGGHTNDASGSAGTVAGGNNNSAQGDNSTVGGGFSNVASGSASTVAGGFNNSAQGDNSTAGGGDSNAANGMVSTVAGGFDNLAVGDHSTVGGGNSNAAGGTVSTVAGGADNTANGDNSTVGGGSSNSATGEASTIGGGESNTAGDQFATVGGGNFNDAAGGYSMVPGGFLNRAGGDFSFAAGNGARVRTANLTGDADGDEGTFVWADSSNGGVFNSTGPNQFLIRAAGGVGINKNNPSSGSLDVAGNGLFSGSVGVGTSTPVSRLDVGGGINATGGIRSSGSSSSHSQGAHLEWNKSNSQETWLLNQGSGGIRLGEVDSGNNVTEYMRILGTTGSVGIGTSTPASRLDVAGGINATGGIRSSGSSSMHSQGAHLEWNKSNAQGETWLLNQKGQGIGGIRFGEVDNLNNVTERMRIENNGNVGIGTTSPSGVLQLGDAVDVSAFRLGNSSNRHHLISNRDMVFNAHDVNEMGTNALYSFRKTTEQFSAIAPVNVLTILDGGEVGIGLIPNHPLHMASDAHVTAGGMWTNASDRNKKENIQTVDATAVLERVLSMPIARWNYKAEDSSIQHIGPMAQDFHSAFGLGHDDKSIGTIDADGVALAAIQGLHGIVMEKEFEISDLRSRAMEKDCEIQVMKSEISDLKELVRALVEKTGDAQ